MTYNIAVAGKGGTGKTTVSGLFIDYLAKAGKGPILAVDADANSNLNEVLGVIKECSLGDIREEIAKADWMEKNPIPPGMSKQEYADFRFNSALIEEDDFDILVMGRTQGKGCYCFVNDILRDKIEKYYRNYKYMVVDNEAGLEHISRGILPPMDLILLVSDCSRRGIQAAGRIAEMIGSLDMKVKKTGLIVNRVPHNKPELGNSLEPGILEEIGVQKLSLIGTIPQDDKVYEYDAAGIPLVSLPDDSPVKAALAEIIKKIGICH
jgi:CO dehydrogenase maturation factor